ncbi:hypothetical protein BC827DRAFT_1263864 [Russula dissimulans]|nr:hypothetical protein BC827DRAFT_1263864 [Russula dissimulans]
MEKQKKKKTVPAALHSEISEYASLLRVLRATDMLDVTTQLTRLDAPPERHPTSVDEEEPGLHEGPTSPDADRRGISGLQMEDKDSILPRVSRNTWTRWPLLAEDLHTPEWTFEDEVHSLAKQVLLSDISTPSQASSDACPELRNVDSSVFTEDQIEALLPPSSLRTLADISSSHLEHVLSALSSYSPQADKSTLHRRHPINWESVLNIVGAAGLVDGNVIRRVKLRLETIYGSRMASSNITSNASEIPATVTLHDLHSANFFDVGHTGNRQKPRPHKKAGRKPSKAQIDQRAGSPAENDT